MQELWWYMTDQMHQLRKKVEAYSEVTAQIDQILEEGQDHVRCVNPLKLFIFSIFLLFSL